MDIYCENCGEKLLENNKICLNCGSKKRKIVLQVKEGVTFHDQIKEKGKIESIKKPIKEFKVGDDFHKKSEKWNHREMYIDRENDDYKEIIKNKETGEIIHKCEEPLSEHKEHGDAKYKKKSKRNI